MLFSNVAAHASASSPAAFAETVTISADHVQEGCCPMVREEVICTSDILLNLATSHSDEDMHSLLNHSGEAIHSFPVHQAHIVIILLVLFNQCCSLRKYHVPS